MARRHFLAHYASHATGAVLAPAASAGQPGSAGGEGPYSPGPLPQPVVRPGDFVFAAAHFDHNHISGQCSALAEAGGTLRWIFEPDARKHAPFLQRYPGVRVARALDEILADPEVRLVTAAAVTSERAALGCRVLEAGKHYFTDKAPCTTLEQLAEMRRVAARTGRKYFWNSASTST